MKKILIALVTLMSVVMPSSAGDLQARLQYIHDEYEARLTKMANQPYDDGLSIECMTMQYNRMYPGTGLAQFCTKFYWTDDENENYMLRPTLYFVTSDTRMCSGIFRYYNEYLFDSTTGELLFVLWVTQMGNDEANRRELRCWFDGDRIIKQLPERIDDESGLLLNVVEVEDSGRVSVASILRECADLKSRFDAEIPTYAWTDDDE